MDALPYWLTLALKPTPALLWMVVGLGLPWALAILPRRDWRSVPRVALMMLVAGPLAMTLWMLAPALVGGADGTYRLTPETIFGGSVVIALVGAGLAFWRWRVSPPPEPTPRQPLALDERLLVTLIIAACALRWLAAMWYPFWEYDALWVYGYEGKLYTLLGHIPQSIGYYPQFLPLQYAYAQIMTGVMDDHVARAAFPLYHWGSILAAYALGRLNFSRRVGVYLAAVWALYPHVGEWATTGDLEVPLTFAATGMAAFFLYAWTHASARGARHHALIAGLFLGLAMWTKPTGGAMIMGVALLVAAELLRVRFDFSRWWPRLMVAVWCAGGTVVVGAWWYLRNVLLGHPPIDLPNTFWVTQAMRSGAEFGWAVLAAALLSLWLLLANGLRVRPSRLRLLIGWALVAAGLLPSIFSPHRMALPEWALLAAGAGVLLSAFWPIYAHHATVEARRDTTRISWALLLALPYFVVWFMSYSYHYRLSFPIVPLLALPVAVVLARWIPAQRQADTRRIAPIVGIPLILAALPGLVAPLHHNLGGWDYLWSNEYPDDDSRLESTNYAVYHTVQTIKNVIAENGLENPVIVAPGFQRLPFFFPLADVRNTVAPTQIRELADVDIYVFSQEARWFYEENGLPEVNQVTGAFPRANVFTPRGVNADASFFGEVYEVLDADLRFNVPPHAADAPAVTWPFAELLAVHLPDGTTLANGRAPLMQLDFVATAPVPLEYTLYIHLLGPDNSVITAWDSFPLPTPYAWYSTRFWETGEYIRHSVFLTLPDDVTLDADTGYSIKIGWYDYFDNYRRVPALLGDGTEVDGIVLPYTLTAE